MEHEVEVSHSVGVQLLAFGCDMLVDETIRFPASILKNGGQPRVILDGIMKMTFSLLSVDRVEQFFPVLFEYLPKQFAAGEER